MIALLTVLSILTQFSFSVAQATDPAPTPSPNWIRPSEIRVKPLPTPSVKPPRVRGVFSKPKSTQPLALNPLSASKKPIPPSETAFLLSKGGADKLILRFQSRIPGLTFDVRAPFVIQLNAEEPLLIQPSVITRENWPKAGTQIDIKYSGASLKQENIITGQAAYSVCEAKTQKCHRAQSPVELRFR